MSFVWRGLNEPCHCSITLYHLCSSSSASELVELLEYSYWGKEKRPFLLRVWPRLSKITLLSKLRSFLALSLPIQTTTVIFCSPSPSEDLLRSPHSMAQNCPRRLSKQCLFGSYLSSAGLGFRWEAPADKDCNIDRELPFANLFLLSVLFRLHHFTTTT